jgi:hypothetical protein
MCRNVILEGDEEDEVKKRGSKRDERVKTLADCFLPGGGSDARFPANAGRLSPAAGGVRSAPPRPAGPTGGGAAAEPNTAAVAFSEASRAWSRDWSLSRQRRCCSFFSAISTFRFHVCTSRSISDTTMCCVMKPSTQAHSRS